MTRPSEIEPLTHPDWVEADPFYIRTLASFARERALVLKQGETFAVFDQFGDIRPIGLAEEGLYHQGTRFLSRLSLRFGRQRPLLLSASVSEDNAWLTVDLTNVDVMENGVLLIPRGTLHLSRVLVLWDGVLHERFTLRNYGSTPVETTLVLGFDADYVDIFEVRGTTRAQRGERLPTTLNDETVVLGYRGLDDVRRQTRIALPPGPMRLTPTDVSFECRLPPQSEQSHTVTYACEEAAPRTRIAFASALASATDEFGTRRAGCCEVVTSDQQFNKWISRSLADLAMMVSQTPHGEYPYAGVPWFSTPFGRDGIITALECLWMNPSLARGVLSYLSATQAVEADPARDAQPGKILHEARAGEMAALGEIPFGRYYGSHDATPLFVMLAAAYYGRTGDRDLIARIWPSIEAALHWIEHNGDMDGDGFVEYARQSPTGLEHQGWKDSHDAVSHADGALAEPPIALCEIQGYVYAAWRGAATLAAVLGHSAQAVDWHARAEALRHRFERQFWSPELGTYALALDGAKRPCLVRASNAGQLLFTGIVSRDRAGVVARTLVAPESFSGWGIRTLATSEARYNPMSYHNGSIWPHDNALIAAGCARYGLQNEALSVMSGLFDASVFMDLHRLPELFCGFPRRPGERPTLYPVACNPQAWAAASVFMFLQAALGLEVEAPERVLRFTRPKLPAFLEEVRLRNLCVGPHTLDLLLERHADDVSITVLRRDGDIEIISIK
jgi:glycogen debranching enzyme